MKYSLYPISSTIAVNKPSFIYFNSENNVEMLKIANDGFYVRGVKVPQDENEAKVVYEQFITWLRHTK